MGIIHSAISVTGDLPDTDYAVIPNDLIDDARLSPLARLLGIWLRSRPKRWTTNEAAMCQAMGVKDPKTVRKALHELYDTGWAKLGTKKSADGRVYQYVYKVRRAGKFRVPQKSIGGNIPPVTTGYFPPSTQVLNSKWTERKHSGSDDRPSAVVIEGPWKNQEVWESVA